MKSDLLKNLIPNLKSLCNYFFNLCIYPTTKTCVTSCLELACFVEVQGNSLKRNIRDGLWLQWMPKNTVIVMALGN
jgi:hypothetical protein